MSDQLAVLLQKTGYSFKRDNVNSTSVLKKKSGKLRKEAVAKLKVEADLVCYNKQDELKLYNKNIKNDQRL